MTYTVRQCAAWGGLVLRFSRLANTTLYSSAASGVPGGDHGHLYFILPKSTPQPATSLTLDQTWTFQHTSLGAGYYLFLEEGQSLQTNDVNKVRAFADRVHALVPRVVSGQHASLGWVTGDPNTPASVRLQTLDFVRVASGRSFSVVSKNLPQTIRFQQYEIMVSPATPFARASGETGFTLSNAGASAPPSRGSRTPTPTGSKIYLSGASAQPVDKIGDSVFFPLSGPERGSMQFTLNGLSDAEFQPGIIDTALYYVVPEPTLGRDQSLRFPILELAGPTGAAGASSAATIRAKLYPANHEDSILGFDTGTPQVLRTFFRTERGEVVYVSPATNAGFKFAHVPNPGVYPSRGAQLLTFYGLTPTGNFELVLDNPSGDFSRLIGGQSGTEYISFKARQNGTPGDYLSFFPGQYAYAPEFSGVQTLQSEMDLLNGTYQTSWVTVGSGNGHIPQYYAQPDDAALHGEPLGGSVYLEYVEVAAADLPAPAPDTSFPLVPLSGVIAPDDRISPPLGADKYKIFEEKFLNPTRKERISGIKTNSIASTNGRSLLQDSLRKTTTPQGMLVDVLGNDWQALTLAYDGFEYLRFANITDDFQDALQSNRLFLVASKGDALADAADYTENKIEITEWPFRIDVGVNPPGTASTGIHRLNNILIFKFVDESFERLAADTRVWANPGTFNDNPSDVQSWLNEYIADAKAKAADPATQALYEPLVNNVLLNPNWTGILALNVSVPAEEMPCAVQGLMGGIRKQAEFKAHHVGFEISKVSADATSIEKSSIFALIDYEDGDPPTGGDPTPDFEFIVKTLKVRFANTEIADFSSTIALVVKKAFEEAVRDPITIPGTGGKITIDTLEMEGSYQVFNGVPTYTFELIAVNNPIEFAGAKDRLSLIHQMTVTKIQFASASCVDSNSDLTSAQVSAKFSIWGYLNFRSMGAFDFFSFDKLVFSDLTVTMSFGFDANGVPQRPNPYGGFVFDPGNLRFSISVSKARNSSLLSAFPLKLSNFHYATHGLDISELGYLEIPNLVPGWGGIDPDDNGSGQPYKPKYALAFTIDIGPLSSQSAKKKPKGAIEIIAAWWPTSQGDGATFGVKLGAGSDGNKEIGVEGVLTLSVDNFGFMKIPENPAAGDPFVYAFFIRSAFLKIVNTQVPPGGDFSLMLFIPYEDSDTVNLSSLGWFVAYNRGGGSSTGDLNNPSPIDAKVVSVSALPPSPAVDQVVTIKVTVENASTAIRPADKITVSVVAEAVDPTTSRPLPPAPPRISKAVAMGQQSGTDDFVFTWPAKQPGTYKFVATATVPGDLAPGNSTGESAIVTVSAAGKAEKRSIVKLDYLGVGHRVQFSTGDTEQRLLSTVESVIDVMRNELVPTQTGTQLREQLEKVYNPEAGLLIGVDVTLFEVVRIAFVFAQTNEMYGALIGFVDKAPSFLKGFQFQILYKKITDDIGVYQMVLQLPDYLRQFELGAASITLPIIGIDIYTNGDFKLDFGFPKNADFSKSFSIQMMAGPIPILGYAGFYFSKLSGATSTIVPVFDANSKAKWDPVLEFGIGLKLGIGKTIEKGPLRAGVSIAIQVILEGALAWYQHPLLTASTLGNPPDWYRVKGQAGLVAQLYGIVDFGIIKVGIEVNASAIFLFVYESYKDIELGVTLNVSVRVSVVIGSFKIFGKKITISISFSFSATFSFEFTIPNPQGTIPPWNGELLNPLAAPVAARSLAALQQADLDPIAWNAATLVHGGTKKDLALTFAPQVTVARDGGLQRAHAVAGLTIGSGGGSDFNDLLSSVISWAVYLHKGTTDPSVSLTVSDLQTLDARLQIPRTLATTENGNSSPLDYAKIRAFMLANFNKISVAAMETLAEDAAEPAAASATVFPMLPEFTMVVSGQGGATQPSVDFAHHNPRSDAYQKAVAAYFDELLVDVEYKSGIFVNNVNLLAHDPSEGVSMATIVVQDYFAFLVKSGVDRAVEYARAELDAAADESITLSALLTALDDGGHFDTVGKMAARFFFHGLRLPPAFDDDDLIALSDSAVPLYELTGQQVPIRLINAEGEGDDATPAEEWSIALNLNTGSDDLIDLSAAELTIATDDDESRANVAALEGLTPATGTVSVTQLDRLASRPREFGFKNPTHVEQSGARVGTLYPLSDVLLDRLTTRGTLDVTPFNRVTDADGVVTNNDVSGISKWALRINFTAKRITRSIDGSGALLNNTYLLGGTSEGARNLIGRLLEGTPSYSDLRLYYELEGKTDALVTDGLGTDADVVLMKTNLSTVSAPQSGAELLSHHPAADDFSAAMTADQASGFLRLIWEASITNAPGYYLYYSNGASSGETGLPDESFGGESHQANLTLVVTFSDLNDACNTLLIDSGSFAEGELFATAAGELSWHPAIAPGAVAFEVTRPNPQHSDSVSSDEIAAALEPMFNLLSYYVDGDGVSFSDSIHGLPVGPTSNTLDEEETPANWTYRQGIKVYPYALPASATPNLYAGTGNEITIGFEFLDIFGNEMPGASIPALVASVYYSDPIKGISQWPSVTSDYLFEANGAAATLTLTLHFTADNYTTSTDDASRVVSALEMYRQIQEQIDDTNVSATLTTSLATTLSHSVLGDLRGFVDDIIAYLEEPAAPGTDTTAGPAPIEKVIEVAITSDQPDNTFAVVVEIAIDRPESMVDPQAKALGDDGQPRMPEAQRVVTPIAPQSTAGIRTLPGDPTTPIPDSEQGMALTAFAEAFEEAFPQFKVATGLGADGPETIWAIRMGGSGMTVQIDGTPVFFAPAPLSNVLMQRDAVPVRLNFPSDATTAETFANVDMDVWGREFLEAVDRFLTADLAVTARKVNAGEYLKIIQAKETLAAAIAEGVTHVLMPDPSDDTFVLAARDAYAQSLLTRLSTAYEVETAVVYSATTTNSFADDTTAPAIAPRLYGSVIGKPIAGTAGEARSDFSLSNTKIALDNSTGPKFAFLFRSDRTQNQASANVDVSYNVTHVEHDIKVAVDGYEASSWLTLLLPEDPIEVGPADIPIALREFPVPPALVRQQALPEDISNATTLERATFWEYVYTYEQQTVAQDSIFANVQFNVGPEIANLRSEEPVLDLFDWLARFNREYPLFSSNLDLLVKGNAELAGTERDAASAAVAWFANLVEGVAGSWGAWVTQAAATRQMLQSLEGFEWDFEIIELFNANEVVIQMALTGESDANARFPDVEVTLEDGSKRLIEPTVNGAIREYRYPWSAAELPETRERTFIFDELHVLNTENGWGGIHLERNLNLTSDLATPRTTNPRFVYQTPEVRFVNKVTPLIDNKSPINISPSGSTKSLNAHLTDMLNELFEQAGDNDTRDRLMKVGCRYSYDVRGQAGPAEGPGQLDEFQAYMPILQRMTFTIKPNDTADFVNGMVSSINQWMGDVNPSRARGFYEFDITVFAALSSTDLPVLRLRRLWLGLDRIS